MMNDPSTLTFSARLDDCFGSNGIVSIVIGRIVAQEGVQVLDLDTWLMSCRVLGRSVENAILAVVADTTRQAGVERLIGRYRPTPKNGMVRALFPRLGFRPVAGVTRPCGNSSRPNKPSRCRNTFPSSQPQRPLNEPGQGL
jgi:FkbH-like protein